MAGRIRAGGKADSEQFPARARSPNPGIVAGRVTGSSDPLPSGGEADSRTAFLVPGCR